MAQPDALILDFDRSVLPLPGASTVDLAHWQETIRFGCAKKALQQLGEQLAPALTQPPRVAFFGSGDYHHVTCLLLERFRDSNQPIRIVVFDNHPDNMRYPFGIHCGSWVWHASRLPFVAGVDVLGITSNDVEGGHAWENHWGNLRSGKVRYWCVGKNLGWMRRLGKQQHSRSFASVSDLLAAYAEDGKERTEPVYLSIDKDVLSPADAHTNWDQGVMRLEELQTAVTSLKPRIIAADITGEVSIYRYRSRFKRMLSGLDGQSEPSPQELEHWQAQHQAINRRLLEMLTR
ncbi:MAG TPA: arginase family protein [Methylophilaceae bacterium]|nr:arginase family protein [Methylophilaceae bacterium]